MHFEVETFYAKDTKLLHHFFDIHVSFEVLKSTESQILAEAFDLNDFLLIQYRLDRFQVFTIFWHMEIYDCL